MRHIFLSPFACSHISTISLHLLLDRWKQVGEPWVSFTRGVRWKAQYDVILRPPSVPISAPALVWVCSRLQGQTKRGTAAGCQGNTGATHTHTHAQVICVVFRVHTRSDMCGEYVTVVLLAAWVSVCRPELRNLSRLQLMSGNLKLAARHKLYLYSTVSLVSRLVSYFNTDFGNDVLEQRVRCNTRNRIYIELTLIYLYVSY